MPSSAKPASRSRQPRRSAPFCSTSLFPICVGMAQLYGGMDEPDAKIFYVFVCKLRKKLSDATGGQEYIHTVWGSGYQMRDPAFLSSLLFRFFSLRVCVVCCLL